LTPADQEIISLVPLYKFVSAQSKLLDDVSPWFCPVTPRVELRRQDCKIRETGLICLVCETLPDRFDTSRVPESAVIQRPCQMPTSAMEVSPTMYSTYATSPNRSRAARDQARRKRTKQQMELVQGRGLSVRERA
jgi:hypothetical protein